jgi:copper chaperone CopZ
VTSDVSIDIKTKMVTVTGSADIRDMFVSITDAGFKPEAVPEAGSDETLTTPSPACIAEPESSVTTLTVTGMRCMKNCGSKVQRALTALPGVTGS